MQPILATLACLMILISCATPYVPQGILGGYDDIRLDRDTVRVSFRGNAYASRDRVETYMLYRCAEVTVENGYDYFGIIGQNTESKQGEIYTPGYYSSYGTYQGTVLNKQSIFGTAQTQATYLPPQSIQFTKYGATATIKMFRGQKPEGAPAGVFDARELMAYLSPIIGRPQPKASKVQPTPKSEKQEIQVNQTADLKAREWIEIARKNRASYNWAEVIRTASAAISIDPNSIEAYNLRSEAYTEKGLPDKAIEDCERVLELDRSNAIALNNRGAAYYKKGDHAKGLEDLEASCNLGLPDGCANFKSVIGYLPSQEDVRVLQLCQEAYDRGDMDTVIKLTTETIKKYPSDDNLFNFRGIAYTKKGALKEAEEDFNKAITINPDGALAYYNKGYALEQSGKQKEAAIEYEISCNLGLESGCQAYKRIGS